MARAAVIHTVVPDSRQAGILLGQQITEAVEGPPDVVVLFVSPAYDYQVVLAAFHEICHPRRLVGCSSAGEFTSRVQGSGMACALALRSPHLRFEIALGRGLRRDRKAAVEALAASVRISSDPTYIYGATLVLTDALAGRADELVQELTLLTGGAHQFFGGGAGDDGRFLDTTVFYGEEVVRDAAIALTIRAKKPIGIGAGHGWHPATAPYRVTESTGMRIVSLNAIPIAEVLQEYAVASGQRLDMTDPTPFFLHNIFGIETKDGHKLRVPIAFHSDGTVQCAGEIPTSAIVRIMRTSDDSTCEAAARATDTALRQLQGSKPEAALFFDCVATRLRMGKAFGHELDRVRSRLGATPIAGCNTNGQILKAYGQLSGFHNCTAVVCLIPGES